MIGEDVWVINRVSPGDPLLIDRTGTHRLATTDPTTMSINISSLVMPPMLDMVLLHEISHAITMSYNLLKPLRNNIPPKLWVLVEEWSVGLLEHYGIEAIIATSESLGRPLCIRGYCIMN